MAGAGDHPLRRIGTADIGQGDELTGLEAKALASGASQFIQRDLREEFARDYLFRLLRQ